MAARRPLVRIGGQNVRLPASDTLVGAPGTDLSVAGRLATEMSLASSTGNSAVLPAATATQAGLMTAAQFNKLAAAAAPLVGDVLITARAPGSLYLPLSAGVYLQSAYPELFAVIGLGKNDPAADWTTLTAPVPPIPAGSFFGAMATDRNGRWIAVVVNASAGYLPGYIARSADNGATWSAIRVSTTLNLSNIATDGTGVWCMGSTGGSLIKSIDHGLTWDITTPFGSVNVSGISTDGAGVWVAVASSGTVAYRSTDNAQTWTTVTLPITGSWVSIDTNRQGAWIMVSATGGIILRSTNNGLTWVRVTISGTPAFKSVASNGRTTWVAAGAAALRSTDGGLTWNTVSLGVTGTAQGSISASSRGVWLAAFDSAVVRSVDDGATWLTLPAAGSSMMGIANDNKGTWMVGGRAAALRRGVPLYDFDPATQFQLPDYMTPEGVNAYIRAKSA